MEFNTLHCCARMLQVTPRALTHVLVVFAVDGGESVSVMLSDARYANVGDA